MPPCQRYLTPADTHDLCVMCLVEEYARSVLDGAEWAHCESFSMKKLRSCVSLVSKDKRLHLRGPGPANTEAKRRMRC